jgi:hypothetical protein
MEPIAAGLSVLTRLARGACGGDAAVVVGGGVDMLFWWSCFTVVSCEAVGDSDILPIGWSQKDWR